MCWVGLRRGPFYFGANDAFAVQNRGQKFLFQNVALRLMMRDRCSSMIFFFVLCWQRGSLVDRAQSLANLNRKLSVDHKCWFSFPGRRRGSCSRRRW